MGIDKHFTLCYISMQDSQSHRSELTMTHSHSIATMEADDARSEVLFREADAYDDCRTVDVDPLDSLMISSIEQVFIDARNKRWAAKQAGLHVMLTAPQLREGPRKYRDDKDAQAKAAELKARRLHGHLLEAMKRIDDMMLDIGPTIYPDDED